MAVDSGHTTRDEAMRVHGALGPRGTRRILLLADSLHLARAIPVFQRVGFEVQGVPVDELSMAVKSPEARLELARWLAREAIARLYYRAAGYF